MRGRLIGVGSPFGDDAVGLAVAAWLAARPLPSGVAVAARDRPGLALADELDAGEAVVLVDALPPAGRPGRVRVFGPEALEARPVSSSHGLGPAHALRLAAALGRAPAALRLVGVEAARLEGGALSPAVRGAVAPAARRALAELRALGAGAAALGEGGARA